MWDVIIIIVFFFDGAIIVYAVVMVILALIGGLDSVLDFFTENLTTIIIVSVAILALYVISVYILSKKGEELEGSPLGNTIVSVFAGSQLVFFAIYALYKIALYANAHPIIAVIYMILYLFALFINACLLGLATLDYDEFIIDSYIGCGIVLGILGWGVNIFLIVS